MPFVTMSNQYAMNGQTQLDNIFVSEFLPLAPENCVRVYVYGLFLAASSLSGGNSVEQIAERLGLQPDEVLDAYGFWHELGLVQMRRSPPEVQYLPVRAIPHSRKFKRGKYDDFNAAINSVITGRMPPPNEFNQYYSLMEDYRIEPEAMIMIAKYCVLLKGDNINCAYILAVARAWAEEGVTTVARVDEKLNEMEYLVSDMSEVLKALGIKRTPDIEERQLYRRFTDELGFTKSAVVHAAKKCKKGGFKRLERQLMEFYTHRALDAKEMDAYLKNRERLNDLCYAVNRKIGVYYDSIDNVLETYIIPWKDMGFEDDALITVADYCFKSNIRTLDGMNGVIKKFYKNGLVSDDAITRYMARSLDADEKIAALLSAAGLSRAVSSWDRDSYRTWTYSWKLPDELLLHAAKLAEGKSQPIAYMNKLLSGWQSRGITTVAAAQSDSPAPQHESKTQSFSRNYTKQEWESLIDNIDDDWV